MTAFVRVMLLLLATYCAPCARLAHGTERTGDGASVYALESYEERVAALERELLSSIDIAPDEERFALYRTYNRLMGTWLQIHFLQTQLDRAVAATSDSDEEDIRTTLRDQAQFALAEIDHALEDFDAEGSGLRRADPARIDVIVRALLSEIEPAIGQLGVDQCARIVCSSE